MIRDGKRYQRNIEWEKKNRPCFYDRPRVDNLSRPHVMVALGASYARVLGVAILPTAFRRMLEAQK
ncbi:hypothetical protein K470DRAFT_257708 [Piedraia hortae CBS 480.64]|uniref:Uncharacterized protein n=1 Tax=Piedraia hortae CBS 480.64 TaxID=1314780 RepID=A0A6A7C172_9PEZI|nr:hypothetical protein K470DRAFT_257708 [Piedraia hortae CBS 480.64]